MRSALIVLVLMAAVGNVSTGLLHGLGYLNLATEADLSYVGVAAGVGVALAALVSGMLGCWVLVILLRSGQRDCKCNL